MPVLWLSKVWWKFSAYLFSKQKKEFIDIDPPTTIHCVSINTLSVIHKLLSVIFSNFWECIYCIVYSTNKILDILQPRITESIDTGHEYKKCYKLNDQIYHIDNKMNIVNFSVELYDCLLERYLTTVW